MPISLKTSLYLMYIQIVCVFDSVTEMVLCLACVALGVTITTSTTMTTMPLTGTLDRSTLVSVSVALGRFGFTVLHQMGQICRRGIDVTWTVFRTVHVIVNVVCLLIVILIGDNLILGPMILLLELGIFVEEASRAVGAGLDRVRFADRLERVLTLSGVVLVVPLFFCPSALTLIAFYRLEGPFVLSPPEVGLLFFAVAFYTLIALLLLARQYARGRQQRRQLAVLRSLKVPAGAAPRPNSGGRALSVYGRRRRLPKRTGAEWLLRGTRGRRVRRIRALDAVRIAASSVRGLPRYHQRLVTLSLA